jgi:ABC-type arginine transport system ATPase subunit
MAKLIQQTLTIQLSRLVRSSDDAADIIDPELASQIEAIIAELAGSDVLVEIDVSTK